MEGVLCVTFRVQEAADVIDGFGVVNWVMYWGMEALNLQGVKKSVKALRNTKAAGINEVTGEIKNGGDWVGK